MFYFGSVIPAGMREDDMEKHEHEHDCAEAVKEVKSLLPNDETLSELAELFKFFGDYTRVKILYGLFSHDMCVNDISEVVGASQSAVSHQLRLLRGAGLISGRREGKLVIYSLADDHVRSIIEQGMEHVLE